MHHGPQQVGGFTFQEDGRWLLFRERDVAVFDPVARGEPRPIASFEHDRVPRFNDVIAAPDGRVFAGTMGRDLQGGLFRMDHDRTITSLWRGTNTANGMAFTADLATMYWTDTTGRTIWAFDYDREAGALTNRRPFVQIPEGEGGPDGLTIDTEGRLYSARYGGSGVYVYSPGGAVVEKIELPVPKVTSCLFGGPERDELYITTAGGDPDTAQGEAGAVFRVKPGARGRPEFRSRIDCER